MSETPGRTAKGEVERAELTRAEQTAARRVAESKATVPHLYLEAEAEGSRCLERLAETDAAASGATLGDAAVRAAAIALREFHRLNGAYRDGALELPSRINIGVAIAAETTAVTPTIFDADAKPLAAIASESRRLEAAARDGSITSPQLSGSTFTVVNLSAHEAMSAHVVVNPAHAAALSVGAVIERPIVADGELRAGRIVRLGLSCDARIVQPAQGAEFLARVKQLLEAPGEL